MTTSSTILIFQTPSNKLSLAALLAINEDGNFEHQGPNLYAEWKQLPLLFTTVTQASLEMKATMQSAHLNWASCLF